MNGSPLVSIAMCTYNGAAHVAEQLETLVNQTYSNLEIIIVDDGSKDATVDIIKQYANGHPYIQLYINDENLGYIKNFEKAISLCQGDIIALSDQDDRWELTKIEVMLGHFKDHMLIYHDSEFIDQDGVSLNKKVSDVRNCYSGSDSRVFLFENCVSGHALLFKKELVPFMTGFPSIVMHDWWLAYIACNTGSIGYVDKALVKYRQHSNANTNILRQQRTNSPLRDSLKSIEKQLLISEAFAAYPYNKHVEFKKKLVGLMNCRIHRYTSISLAWFIFKHRNVLLYIQKKSFFSKVNFCLKYAWGFKLKKMLNGQ